MIKFVEVNSVVQDDIWQEWVECDNILQLKYVKYIIIEKKHCLIGYSWVGVSA